MRFSFLRKVLSGRQLGSVSGASLKGWAGDRLSRAHIDLMAEA